MTFDFYVANAAANNTPEARLREATRMACVACGLNWLNHDVRLVNPPRWLVESNRWRYFDHLLGEPREVALTVCPAESLRHALCDVAIKCSVGTNHDQFYVNRCDLLVAHEACDGVANHSRVLHVPFLVHDRVIRDLIDVDLFGAYLYDDLLTLETAVACPSSGKLAGYCGAGWGFRKQFFSDAPEWVDSRFYDTHVMGGLQHAGWLYQFRAGIVLRGDTPKVNLTPLLAMLGIPLVSPTVERNTPPLDDESMIRFTDWDSLKAILDDDARLARIAARATEIYREGWSPIGQARQIVKALEC